MTTVADLAGLALRLPVLIRHVQDGNEVVVRDANGPVARIVPVGKEGTVKKALPLLKISSFTRPRILTPQISRAEIAQDLFDHE